MKLSVVIPAYNEESNIGKGNLVGLYSYLTSQDFEFEVILVDDGSADKTLDKLKQFSKGKPEVKVIASEHMGKSLTVKRGIEEADGDWRLFTDFDQSTPISEIEKFWPLTDKGFEVLVGSRELKDSKRDKEPWYRHLMGRGFNWTVRFFTVKGIMDTQCGFKMFSKKASGLFSELKVTVKPSKVAFTGAFDVELLYLAQRRNIKMIEVPVHWQHYDTERVSPIKDSIKMFIQVVKIWWVGISGNYEK